jgi:hypothetical protein
MQVPESHSACRSLGYGPKLVLLREVLASSLDVVACTFVLEVHDGESRGENRELGRYEQHRMETLLTLERYKDVVANGLGDAPTNAELENDL